MIHNNLTKVNQIINTIHRIARPEVHVRPAGLAPAVQLRAKHGQPPRALPQLAQRRGQGDGQVGGAGRKFITYELANGQIEMDLSKLPKELGSN